MSSPPNRGAKCMNFDNLLNVKNGTRRMCSTETCTVVQELCKDVSIKDELEVTCALSSGDKLVTFNHPKPPNFLKVW